MKTYSVIHFIAKMKGGVLSTKGEPVEKQVQDIINQQASSGWEFVSFQTAHVAVSPGCLAALMGRKEEIMHYDIMIFSK